MSSLRASDRRLHGERSLSSSSTEAGSDEEKPDLQVLEAGLNGSMEVDEEENLPEDIPEHLLDDPNRVLLPKRLIVAVDFGTTFSAVSFIPVAEGEATEHLGLDRIRTVENYPSDMHQPEKQDQMRKEVPSEVIYPLNPGFRDAEKLSLLGQKQTQMPPDEPYSTNEHEFNGEEYAFSNEMDVDFDDDDVQDLSDSLSFQWGYGVHEAWRYPDTHANGTNKALSRFKLLLDGSERTQKVRTSLERTIKRLRSKKIIDGPLSIIADYLTCLLRHTKAELLSQGYDDTYVVELVLCVPAIWSQSACRGMQRAMATAMKQANFGGADIQNNSIENLFIVSEPEAAAAYVLATDHTIQPYETFVLLDAGGGTVDANTYRVSQTTPLRLSSQVVEPGGGLHGSSYLNEYFCDLLRKKLENEKYLEDNGLTIDAIAETVMMNEFEYRIKRNFDIYEQAKKRSRFVIVGLRDNKERGIERGSLWIPFKEMQRVFLRCFNGVASVMEEQITSATAKGIQISRVVLIGGFAGSVSLRRFLRHRLAQVSQRCGYEILLHEKEHDVTAVASGAVLRALNKEQGPSRQAQSSYGILRTEPFYSYPEHEGLKPVWDENDGMQYIKNTIDWILKKGIEVPPTWKCVPFLCTHTIKLPHSGPLICEEVLYVSDTSTESHYPRSHPKNKACEEAGRIQVDFSFLRDNNIITPVERRYKASNGREYVKRYWKITYTMVLQVIDRDLKCYAIYDGRVRRQCRINIAPSFAPGAK